MAASITLSRNLLRARSVFKPHFCRHIHVSRASSAGFAKELFLGRINKEKVFPYPEPLDQDQRDTLNMLVEPVQRFFEDKVDSTKIDRDANMPQEVLDGLKELGLFGLQIPEEYGGLGLINTSYARVVEAFSQDAAIATTLMAHQSIGLKGILICGNEQQKQKYLPKLATGEHIAAFCLTEPSSGSDAASIQTRAKLSEDGKTFLLNGSKIWITNGGWAHVMTVFARTEVTNAKGEKEDKITAFIVERAFGGVSSGIPEDKLGIRGSNTCEVFFENTPIPIENVLGEVGCGFKVAMTILNSGRFGMGAAAGGGLRYLIALASEHATTRTQFGSTLSSFGQIQEKFAKMTLAEYAIESMAYMTSGMMDTDTEDASIEAAMCKVYGSEALVSGVNESLQTLGGLGFMKSYPYERLLRDTRILLIYEGTNEILRMYIALTGMKYAGDQLKEVVKALKNPFENPGVLWNALRKRGLYSLGVKGSLGVSEVVHPELADCVKLLEDSTIDFGVQSEKLLAKFGKKIIHEQLLLKRMADVAINVFAMTAVLSRCTRTLYSESPTAEHEKLLTTTICQDAYNRNKQLLKEVAKGSKRNGDDNIQRIAEDVFKNGGCIAKHVLDV